MWLLKEIEQKDIGMTNSSDVIKYEVRKSARAVLMKEEKMIALLHVSKKGYYKLPGGGIEEGETIIEGLNREVMEEVGAELDIVDSIGIIIEYREEFEQIQISYNFLCKTKGRNSVPSFTDNEKAHGFKLVWVHLDEALDLVSNYDGHDYLARFIVERDTETIAKAMKMIAEDS